MQYVQEVVTLQEKHKCIGVSKIGLRHLLTIMMLQVE